MENIDFSSINLPVQDIVYNYNIETQRDIFNYLSQLSDTERLVYNIAYEHLESSFNILKSNGFIKWKNNNK